MEFHPWRQPKDSVPYIVAICTVCHKVWDLHFLTKWSCCVVSAQGDGGVPLARRPLGTGLLLLRGCRILWERLRPHGPANHSRPSHSRCSTGEKCHRYFFLNPPNRKIFQSNLRTYLNITLNNLHLMMNDSTCKIISFFIHEFCHHRCYFFAKKRAFLFRKPVWLCLNRVFNIILIILILYNYNTNDYINICLILCVWSVSYSIFLLSITILNWVVVIWKRVKARVRTTGIKSLFQMGGRSHLQIMLRELSLKATATLCGFGFIWVLVLMIQVINTHSYE